MKQRETQGAGLDSFDADLLGRIVSCGWVSTPYIGIWRWLYALPLSPAE